MSSKPIRNFDAFRDAVSTYRLPRIIFTALDLDLFTVVGQETWSVPNLAKRLKVSERGLSILCRNLATAGLLVKKQNSYRNSNVSKQELNRKSRDYRGAYLNLLRTQWDDWGRLTHAVKTGQPLDRDEPDHPSYRREFSWAMHHRSKDIAPLVVSQLRLGGAKTLLDLGGGPGTYALAFLAKHAKLRATLCDRAPALSVARKIAAPLPEGRRLAYVPLDFMKRNISGTYDVIWYSNVLHIYSPEENQQLFRRLMKNLTPSGRLFIQDAFTWDREGLEPADVNLFAVTMLLFTETGNTYSGLETMQWLRQVGFQNVRRIAVRKGSEDWRGGILEATRPKIRHSLP